MPEKTLERRSADRYTIHILLVVLGLLMGYVGQGERIRPLISQVTMLANQNSREIIHVQEKNAKDFIRLEEKLDDIHEYIQREK